MIKGILSLIRIGSILCIVSFLLLWQFIVEIIFFNIKPTLGFPYEDRINKILTKLENKVI
jgi:hypothetical protein